MHCHRCFARNHFNSIPFKDRWVSIYQNIQSSEAAFFLFAFLLSHNKMLKVKNLNLVKLFFFPFFSDCWFVWNLHLSTRRYDSFGVNIYLKFISTCLSNRDGGKKCQSNVPLEHQLKMCIIRSYLSPSFISVFPNWFWHLVIRPRRVYVRSNSS